MSPALAGQFLSTAPPGKSHGLWIFFYVLFFFLIWLPRVLVVAYRIFLLWRGASELTGSVVALPRFSCSEACGILVPQSGIESRTLALEAQSPNHWTTREVLWTVDFAADTQCVYTWEARVITGLLHLYPFSQQSRNAVLPVVHV